MPIPQVEIGAKVEDTPEVAEKKEKAKERGCGRARAYVFIEKESIIASITDFFEGETVAIVASVGKKEITGTESGHCNARIAKSDLKVCVKNISYEYDGKAPCEFSITYAGVEKKAIISPDSPRAHLLWGEEDN